MIGMADVKGYRVGATTFMRANEHGFAYNRAWRHAQETGERIVTIPRKGRAS